MPDPPRLIHETVRRLGGTVVEVRSRWDTVRRRHIGSIVRVRMPDAWAALAVLALAEGLGGRPMPPAPPDPERWDAEQQLGGRPTPVEVRWSWDYSPSGLQNALGQFAAGLGYGE